MKGIQSHRLAAFAIAAASMMAMTACGSTSTSGVTTKQPPTAGMKPPTSVAATGEGALNLIDWGGYVQTLWQKPFEDATGCKIHYQDAGSSDEMVSLMTGGGGGNWDMVSASGDADLRLIYNGSVKPMNMDLIPDWKNFGDKFKSPPFNTINGVHYGVSLQWGPNTLLYNTDKFPTAPTTWGVLYDPQYSGLITIPDNPIQIADAALYLSVKNPSLKITDPYELTQKQFDAVVNLLKTQKSYVKKYWAAVSDEESLFKSGDVVLGAAWPIMTTDLHLAGAHTADTIPSEGVGRVDQHSEGAGGAGDQLRRDPGQHQGLRGDGVAEPWLMRGLPRQRPGDLLQQHQVLEDAHQHMRRRNRKLHDVRPVAVGLDDDQGVTTTVSSGS